MLESLDLALTIEDIAYQVSAFLGQPLVLGLLSAVLALIWAPAMILAVRRAVGDAPARGPVRAYDAKPWLQDRVENILAHRQRREGSAAYMRRNDMKEAVNEDSKSLVESYRNSGQIDRNTFVQIKHRKKQNGTWK